MYMLLHEIIVVCGLGFDFDVGTKLTHGCEVCITRSKPERTSFELVTDIFLGGSSKQSEAQFMRAVTSSWGVQNDEEQLGWGLLA